MFKITNVDNGKTFTHYTKMGVQQDETILFRYGVPFVVEEVDAMDDQQAPSMDNMGWNTIVGDKL
tara:strand:+ start:735 stop:929 length:195 start_codon:yes stop_codon:yes gene_type:complete